MNGSMALFLDTNSLLHYPPIQQVEWQKTCDNTTVRLVLCMQVIMELDEKKSDPRLADRAQRIIKEIKEIRSKGNNVRDGVTLELFTYEDASHSKDNRIVQSAKKYQESNPGVRVVVYTEDAHMTLRCEANEVAFIEPDKIHRLEDVQDELTKKYRQAVTKLEALENRVPKLTFVITPKGDPAKKQQPPNFTLAQTWEPLDEAEASVRIREKYPLHSEARHPHEDNPVAHWHMVTHEQWKEFNNKLESFYAIYASYMRHLNLMRETNTRTINFDVWLHNFGNTPATDIDVYLSFPTTVAILDADSEEVKAFWSPSPPEPPEQPKPSIRRLPEFSPNWAAVPDSALNKVRLRESNHVEVQEIENVGYRIHGKVHNLKHGPPEKLGAFKGVFTLSNPVKPFDATFTISAAELPAELSGKIPFIVNVK